MLGRVGAVETDARSKDTAIPELARPLHCQALARRPHDEAGAIVEAAADFFEVLPEKRLAPRERHDNGAPVLQLCSQGPEYVQGEVLLAAARIVAVPAMETAAVGDGEGDGIKAFRIVLQEMIRRLSKARLG